MHTFCIKRVRYLWTERERERIIEKLKAMKFHKRSNNIIFNNWWQLIIIFDNNCIFCIVIFSNCETVSFHRWATFKLGYPGQKDARSFGKLFSEGIKRDNKTGLSRYSYCPSDFYPSSRHIVPCTTNSSSPVVSVKQPLFHLVLPEYPRALSCSISKCHSYVSIPFPRSLSPFSKLVHVRLYFSLSLLLTSRYIPIIFPLFHRPGTTASSRDEDVPRGRGVRLNIDYARFETRVMREADRVNPACATTWAGKKQLIVRGRWNEGWGGDGRDIELTAKSFPIRWGTIRRREWWAYGRVEKAIC